MDNTHLYECLICHNMFKRRSLPNHIHSSHGLKAKDYYDLYIEPNAEHICTCGEQNKFKNIFTGYSKHCSTKCSSLDPNVQDKLKITNQEKYGVNYNLQREEIIQKSHTKEVRQKAFNSTKETWNSKYGMHPMQTAEIKEKVKQTNRLKYNTDWITQSKDFKDHMIKTVNKKSSEIECYEYLKSLYNVVKRNYKSEKYPFHCDLYVEDIDTYIELNLFWVHGKHKFDPNNINDLNILKKWKNKNLDSYNRAIYIWTISDILKYETAIKNNLNYLTFYSKQDFYNYFNNKGGNL